MPQIRTPLERATLSEAYALSASLVQFAGQLYLPVHFLTKKPSPALKPSETIWVSMDQPMLRVIANRKLDMLFVSDGEERSFHLMLQQFSRAEHSSKGILIRTAKDKLRVLLPDGTMVKHEGHFVSNF